MEAIRQKGIAQQATIFVAFALREVGLEPSRAYPRSRPSFCASFLSEALDGFSRVNRFRCIYPNHADTFGLSVYAYIERVAIHHAGDQITCLRGRCGLLFNRSRRYNHVGHGTDRSSDFGRRANHGDGRGRICGCGVALGHNHDAPLVCNGWNEYSDQNKGQREDTAKKKTPCLLDTGRRAILDIVAGEAREMQTPTMLASKRNLKEVIINLDIRINKRTP